MIFAELMLGELLAERKTVTRRRVKPGELTCRYVPGRDYAVQPGRGKKAVARIRIVSVRAEWLGEIGDFDAGKEGFDHREAFIAYWTDLYGEFDAGLPVWRIEFELLPREDGTT